MIPSTPQATTAPTAGTPARSAAEHHEVVVVGAGPSGIGAAIRLREAGVEDLLIVEKADSFGGTWRANTYPGCACDVPSALYSFSFAPNPGWTRAFAGQQEILAYLRDVAHRHGLERHTRFGTEMTAARWQGDHWRIRTSRGEVTARFLVAGAGPWNEPLLPDLPGLERFDGPVFHSAGWDHDVDLRGLRVAVVGSGASAVQFVPEIAPVVSRLHLFQRTAQWVLPKPDYPVPRSLRRWMRTFPATQRALRATEYAAMEALGTGFRHPRLMKVLELAGRAHLRATVADPEVRRRLTPTYTLGCKRLLFSNAYYPALAKPHVDVHATAVTEVHGNRVLGADGSDAEVDAIILGTGFRILDMPVADRVLDAEGRSLADHWQGSPQAYRGTMAAGFPNAFLLLGPSLGTGHTSAFTILEAQLDLLVSAVTRARAEDWRWLEVRREAQDAFNAEVQAALPGTVYNAGGCSSYYLDGNGRNSFSWPWSTGRMRRDVPPFEPAAFLVETGRPGCEAVARSA